MVTLSSPHSPPPFVSLPLLLLPPPLLLLSLLLLLMRFHLLCHSSEEETCSDDLTQRHLLIVVRQLHPVPRIPLLRPPLHSCPIELTIHLRLYSFILQSIPILVVDVALSAEGALDGSLTACNREESDSSKAENGSRRDMIGPGSPRVPSREEAVMFGALLIVEDVVTPETSYLLVHVLKIAAWSASSPISPLSEGLVASLIEG